MAVLDRLKQLNQMRKTAGVMQKQLAQEVLEVSHKGYTIRIQGDMQLQSIAKEGQALTELKEAVNRAIKESQKLAAKKMRGKMGDLGIDIPGL